MKKYCNKKTYLICSLTLIVFIYFISLLVFGTKDYTIINKPVRDVLTKQPKLEDDYYNNMNYKYLSKNQLKDDEAVWYYMYTDSQKAIDDEKIKIIDDILNNCDKHATGSVNEKICLFYKSYKVEGKDDIANVKRAVDCEMIATNGLGFGEELINRLIKINERCGIIILTDPDYAGKRIRARLARHIPTAKHAYIDRKKAIKKGDLGVENAEPEVIIDALKRAKAEETSRREEFTMADLVKNGLSTASWPKESIHCLAKSWAFLTVFTITPTIPPWGVISLIKPTRSSL